MHRIAGIILLATTMFAQTVPQVPTPPPQTSHDQDVINDQLDSQEVAIHMQLRKDPLFQEWEMIKAKSEQGKQLSSALRIQERTKAHNDAMARMKAAQPAQSTSNSVLTVK